MTKKAQMEIMGLIVIVVLLTLGMFFIVTFQSSRPEKQIQKNFEDDQLASNFVISFLNTDACAKHTIEDLIQDCAVEKKISCDGNDSCIYVNDTLNFFLEETLVEWKKKFNFTIDGLSESISFASECNSGMDRISYFQPTSLYPFPGTVIIKLEICK